MFRQLQAAKHRFNELVTRERPKGWGDDLVKFLRAAPDFDQLELRRWRDHGREHAL
jgi:hypothetical protein